MFPVGIFFHLFTYHLFTGACFLYSTGIVYLYSYLLKVSLSTFTIPEMESERKIILDSGLRLPLDLINLFDIVLSFKNLLITS